MGFRNSGVVKSSHGQIFILEWIPGYWFLVELGFPPCPSGIVNALKRIYTCPGESPDIYASIFFFEQQSKFLTIIRVDETFQYSNPSPHVPPRLLAWIAQNAQVELVIWKFKPYYFKPNPYYFSW